MPIRIKLIRFILLCVILSAVKGQTVAQNTETKALLFDSLVSANERYQKQDLTKLKMLSQLAKGYPNVNPSKGIEAGLQAIALAQKFQDKSGQLLLAEAYYNKGLNHAAKSEYPIALELFEKALNLNQKQNNPFGIASNTLSIGDVFRQKGDNKNAKEYIDKALAIFETIQNKAGIARAYNGIGNIYISNEPRKALEYFQKALDLNEQLGYKSEVARNIGNIGNVYINISDYPKALEYYQKALGINEQLGNKSLMATNLGNISRVYLSLSDYPKALEYSHKALGINEQLGNKYFMAGNLGNLGRVYLILSDNPKALEYFQRSLDINEQIGNKNFIASNLSDIGNVYLNLSDYPKALEYQQKALAINEQLGNKSGMATNLGIIGSVYRNLSDYPKALEYQQKALSITELLGNKRGVAASLSSIGIVFYYLFNYPKALEYYQKALAINEQLGNKNGVAGNLSNIGAVYNDLFDYPKALEYFQKALAINEQLGNKNYMATNLGNIGAVYRDASDSVLKKLGIKPTERYIKALEYLNRGLQISKEIGEISKQKEAWFALSITYEKQGNFNKAHEAYKNFILLRDSIESGEVKIKIERKTIQYEFDKKETEFRFQQQLSEEKLLRSTQEATLSKQQLQLSNKEKDLQHLAFLKEKAEKQEKEKQLTLSQKEKLLQSVQLQNLGKEKALQQSLLELSQAEVQSKNQQRNGFIIGSVLLLLLAGAIFIGLRKTAKEKNKSEKLLLNILPSEIAEELKNKGKSIARQYNNVSVIFTDFVNFTSISEQLSPTELVQEIHANFTAFDAIMEKHGIEKIKTIGDAYLAVCGLPNEVADHAQRITKAALEIQEFMLTNGGKFQVRIGIHSGPVVAGIVGVKKFAYDIWGDTVNMAARMEQHSEPGKINISQATYDLLMGTERSRSAEFEYRGKITAKNKGEVDMYFVSLKK